MTSATTSKSGLQLGLLRPSPSAQRSAGFLDHFFCNSARTSWSFDLLRSARDLDRQQPAVRHPASLNVQSNPQGATMLELVEATIRASRSIHTVSMTKGFGDCRRSIPKRSRMCTSICAVASCCLAGQVSTLLVVLFGFCTFGVAAGRATAPSTGFLGRHLAVRQSPICTVLGRGGF